MSNDRGLNGLTMFFVMLLAAWIVLALEDIAHAIESACK